MLLVVGVGDIIFAYKSITTKLSNRIDNSQGRTLWQRNYYEHIIRNNLELQRIREYILTNPKKWQEDKCQPKKYYHNAVNPEKMITHELINTG